MTSHSKSELSILDQRGAQLRLWLDQVAELRIRVFREYPYLYDGNHAYERDYLQTYAEAVSGLLVLALDGEQVVGAATALALMDEDRAFAQGLESAGFDRGQVYYFGESVLMPEYRGRGMGVAFMRHREAEARRQGKRWCAFCAVQRPDDHPMRPNTYAPLDAFWEKRGYQPLPGVTTTFAWKDVDQPAETEKSLQFWIKEMQTE